MRVIIIWLAIALGVYSTACCSGKKVTKTNVISVSMVPKVIIYQTTRDYSMYVPVILSEDKKSIESYPGISDVYTGGQLAYPTALKKGFWLDNRGISPRVAFLNITYEQYAKLQQTPSTEELMKMILDDAPLLSMYRGKARTGYSDIVKDLNKMIKKGDFSDFEKIK